MPCRRLGSLAGIASLLTPTTRPLAPIAAHAIVAPFGGTEKESPAVRPSASIPQIDDIVHHPLERKLVEKAPARLVSSGKFGFPLVPVLPEDIIQSIRDCSQAVPQIHEEDRKERHHRTEGHVADRGSRPFDGLHVLSDRRGRSRNRRLHRIAGRRDGRSGQPAPAGTGQGDGARTTARRYRRDVRIHLLRCRYRLLDPRYGPGPVDSRIPEGRQSLLEVFERVVRRTPNASSLERSSSKSSRTSSRATRRSP